MGFNILLILLSLLGNFIILLKGGDACNTGVFYFARGWRGGEYSVSSNKACRWPLQNQRHWRFTQNADNETSCSHILWVLKSLCVNKSHGISSSKKTHEWLITQTLFWLWRSVSSANYFCEWPRERVSYLRTPVTNTYCFFRDPHTVVINE